MSENNDFIQLPPLKKDTPADVVAFMWEYMKVPEDSREKVKNLLKDANENGVKISHQAPTLYDVVPKEEIAEFEELMRKTIADIVSEASSVACVMRRSSGSSYPRLAVKLPCGSASISNTFLPSLASPMPTFTVVVVFPTPPFWFTTDITLHMISSSFNFPMILFSIISTVPVFPASSLPVYRNSENTYVAVRL